VSGAYEHTITQQPKGNAIEALVIQGKYAGIVLGMPKAKAAAYKSPADLKGLKIGVTAPGSSTNMFVNILLAKQGLKPDAAAYIGVGATAGAVAIMKRGEIDAISNLDPVISMLEADGTIVPVVDTRTPKGMQEVYNGAYAAGSIYAPAEFARKYPNTAQAVVNAIVRALRFIQHRRPTRSSRRAARVLHRQGALQGGAREEPRRLQARRHDPAGRVRERVPRPQDLRSGAPERDRRSREDGQHAVRAEGRREIQVTPALALSNVTCTFAARGGAGRYTAVAIRRSRSRPASSCRSSGRPAAASRRCSTSPRACSSRRPAASRSRACR
jgi:hypothetical protein